MSRDDTGHLDQDPRVQKVVEDIEADEYDYLAAYDDRRICRDDYLAVIEYESRKVGARSSTSATSRRTISFTTSTAGSNARRKRGRSGRRRL